MLVRDRKSSTNTRRSRPIERKVKGTKEEKEEDRKEGRKEGRKVGRKEGR